MATRIPLVINAGQIQQLQSGDTLAGSSASTNFQVTQTADAALIAGQVVYSSAADHVNKAQANSSGTAYPIGLAAAAIGSLTTGSITVAGVVVLTTTQWDAVFGTTGGLVYNTIYYLSAATAGLGTSTAPTTVGQYVVELGKAISTTELLLTIKQSILL